MLNERMGNPAHRKTVGRAEPQPEQLTNTEPPAYLDDVAAQEWRRLVPELLRLQLITVADVTELALYCMAFADFLKYTKFLEENGDCYETERGIRKAHPENILRAKAFNQILRTCDAFGFSPGARARMAITLTAKSEALTLDQVLSGDMKQITERE